MFDTHCHLYQSHFIDDFDQILHESIRKDVRYILVPGIDIPTSKKSIDISQAYPSHVFPAVGIHPNYSNKSDIKEFLKLIKSHREKIYAIGEIGLDFYRNFSPRELQIEVFNRMIKLSLDNDLPICIHNRNADQEILEILSSYSWKNETSRNKNFNGVFHAFNGSELIAEWGVSHNFLFGIGGPVTYKKSDRLRNAIKTVGLGRLVLETDAPYLAPVPHRGKRNLPQYLPIIAQSIANVLGVNFDMVVNKTNSTAKRLFRI